MGILTKLFGYEGKVRFEGETYDGRSFEGTGRIETIGMNKQEVEKDLMNALYVETGIRYKSLRIVAVT